MPTNSDKDSSPKRIAIIHDWLVTFRGGEKVLEAITELFPYAELFTLYYTPGKVSPKIEGHKIHSSFLNRLPLAKRFYRYTLPLMPLAIESFDLTDFDLVISSSHCVAKGIIPSPDALHICYCHTPMRYAWDQYRVYFGGCFKQFLFLPSIHRLRQWDVTSSHRVDHFIANSEWVKNRILKYYRRDAEVIPPFFELSSEPTSASPKDYYLVVAGLSPYKRIDIAIEACRKLNRRLMIVGAGQDEKKLLAMADNDIKFLGRVSDEELRKLYGECRALLFPGAEDFGIAPLEAMACGRPVIAYGKAGVTETVVDRATGLFFLDQTADSLCDAIVELEKLLPTISSDTCRKQAERFSRKRFQESFQNSIQRHWKDHVQGQTNVPQG